MNPDEQGKKHAQEMVDPRKRHANVDQSFKSYRLVFRGVGDALVHASDFSKRPNEGDGGRDGAKANEFRPASNA